MGLFHGSKPLCPNVSHVLKGSSDESGIYEVEKVTVFSIGQIEAGSSYSSQGVFI